MSTRNLRKELEAQKDEIQMLALSVMAIASLSDITPAMIGDRVKVIANGTNEIPVKPETGVNTPG